MREKRERVILSVRASAAAAAQSPCNRSISRSHALLFGFIMAFGLLVNGVKATALEGTSIADRVVEHKLKNGMTFLFLQRSEAPVFSAYLRFKAGGVNEPVGKTGLAHLLEHMAFKGTKHLSARNYRVEKKLLDQIERLGEELSKELSLGDKADQNKIQELRKELEALQQKADAYTAKEEIWDTYEKNGGVGLNASTSKDMTSYYLSLPSNRLELWALIESQRMREAVMREFYRERDVVAEERRRGYEDRPDGKLYERFISTAFIAHPYRNPTIGWMSDIQTITMADAENFYKEYYIPSRAVAAVVGDIDIQKSIAVVERYFGSLPGRPDPPPVTTQEPAQGGERRTIVQFDAEPSLMVGFHKPTLPNDDDFVFDVIDALLTRGRSSRLYTRLVKQEQVASSVGSFSAPDSLYPNLFVLSIDPRHPRTAADVEKVLYEELQRMKDVDASDEELLKVKNQLKADFLRSLRSNSGLADKLSYFETLGVGWRYPVEWVDRIDKISAADVRRVAAKYFTEDNRTVATLAKPSS